MIQSTALVNPVTPSLRSGHFHGHFVMNIHSSLGLHPEHSGYGVKRDFLILFQQIMIKRSDFSFIGNL